MSSLDGSISIQQSSQRPGSLTWKLFFRRSCWLACSTGPLPLYLALAVIFSVPPNLWDTRQVATYLCITESTPVFVFAVLY